MKNNQNNARENLSAYRKYLTLITLALFALGCLFTFNAFRSIVGFLTNKFDYPLQSIAMITPYILPIFCFIFFFFNSFIKPNKKITRYIYTIFVIIMAIFNIIIVSIFFKDFYKNSEAGHYVNFTTIGLTFPVDVLAVNVILLLIQAFNLYILIKPNSKYAFIKDAFGNYGFFKFKMVEKVFLTIFAVFTMLFIGDFFNGFYAIDNVSYDGRYIFLMLMTFIIPLINFVYFLIKPSIRSIAKKTNTIIHSIVIGINVLFALLFAIFVGVSPEFLITVGKPLFPLDFTISIPVFPYLLLLILSISTIFELIIFIKYLKTKKED